MKVGDLVKIMTALNRPIGIVVDISPSRSSSVSRYIVISGDDRVEYLKTQLELVSESR